MGEKAENRILLRDHSRTSSWNVSVSFEMTNQKAFLEELYGIVSYELAKRNGSVSVSLDPIVLKKLSVPTRTQNGFVSYLILPYTNARREAFRTRKDGSPTSVVSGN